MIPVCPVQLRISYHSPPNPPQRLGTVTAYIHKRGFLILHSPFLSSKGCLKWEPLSASAKEQVS